MDVDDLKAFEETIWRGRNGSIKAWLVTYDDNDDDIFIFPVGFNLVTPKTYHMYQQF